MPSAGEISALQMQARTDTGAELQLKRAAAAGMPEAQLALGRMLLLRGGSGELSQALAWLNSAAARPGDVSAAARTELGKLYFRGAAGMPRDYQKALALLDAAAQQDSAVAAYYLGLIYRNGLAGPADKAAAASWMLKSAGQHIPAAMFIVANMYLAGEGLPQNDGEARKWLEKAAEMEHPEALQLMAIGLHEGTMGFPRDEKLAQQQMQEAAHALTHRAIDP
ncbi:hypothetical protein GCM10011396_04130 [Undibacterium terreum]|uniref:Sel1 repeat family protein n=2 Tax=Undibacterium terreum TaxID=1224302 RepID=A0A916U4K6_9BURK|nr:hypothetical protein GCM10011396_04130 [Undibacterium terreum]